MRLHHFPEEVETAARRTNQDRKMLSDDDKRAFIRDGYLHLHGAISEELVQAALKVIDEAHENGQYTMRDKKGEVDVPNFDNEIAKHPDIGKILDRSGVIEACEDLIGKGLVEYARRAQIAFRPQDTVAMKQGLTITDVTPPHHYHIDGGTASLSKTATPFTLLVGVCLSPGQAVDELRGQFTAWPGSHVKLHEVVRERWEKGLIDGASVFGGRDSKPDIGPSKRLLTKPGDVILAHQRLGHSGGINVHPKTRKNLYFRIHHKNHEENVENVIKGSVYTEYEGLHHLVDDL